MTRGIRVAVEIMGDRMRTRRIAVTCLSQCFIGPRAARIDGKTGCAIAANGGPANLFERQARTAHVFEEGGAVLIENRVVVLSMAGQFMPGIHDPTDQGRVVIGDAAEGKERPRRAAIGKYLENTVGIGFNPALMAGPVGAVDDGGERMDVEVFLHVDCQGTR